MTTTYSAEVLADLPLAYYRMGEASGTTLVDSSGNGRNGDYGNVTLGQPSLVATDTANTSARLSPNGGRAVGIFNAGWMNFGPAWSVSALVKMTSFAGQPMLISRFEPSAGVGGWWIGQITPGSGKIAFRIVQTTGVVTIESSKAMVIGSVYHVAATYSSGTMRLYLNGAQVASAPVPNAAYNPNRNLEMGDLASLGGFGWSGYADEVAIFGTALTPERVLAQYAATGLPVVGLASLPAGVPALPTSIVNSSVTLEDVTALIHEVRLLTALGDDTTPGAEVTGGGYAPFPSGGYVITPPRHASAQHGGLTSLPTCDLVGWEAWGGSTRYAYGLFHEEAATVTASDDTIHHGYGAYWLGGGMLLDASATFNLRWPDGTRIVFRPGHAPAGLSAGVAYFVRDATTTTFKVAATAGGSAIDLTADTAPGQFVCFGPVISVAAGDVAQLGQITLHKP